MQSLMLNQLFFLILCVHIIVNAKDWDDRAVLRQDQREKNTGQAKVQQKDNTDYVTQEEFDNAMNVVTSEINRISTQLQLLDQDFRPVETTVNTDNCVTSPCKNQGTCKSRLKDYVCFCKLGYEGPNCEYEERSLNVLSVDNGNKQGSWEPWDRCPSGSYARNFVIKLEPYKSSVVDYTGMNNIEFDCRDPSTGEDIYRLKSGSAPYGNLQTWQACPEGEFLVGFSLKVDVMSGNGDNSGVNGITMTCSGGTELTGEQGPMGNYGSTVLCPENHVICGVTTRLQQYPAILDDTGLNDLKMKCCRLY